MINNYSQPTLEVLPGLTDRAKLSPIRQDSGDMLVIKGACFREALPPGAKFVYLKVNNLVNRI